MYPDSSATSTAPQAAAVPQPTRGRGQQMDSVKVAPDNFDQVFFMRDADKPQKKTRDGVPVWSVQATGIDWRGNPQSLSVTVPMFDNPAEHFTPGQPVELVGLVYGVTPKRDGVGFVTWCSADDLRPAVAAARATSTAKAS
jgi:hypothetical protein